MRFTKIRLKNIRSYAEQEFIFPQGSLLLAGDVGAGKTSILLALEYALFGLQPGQKGSALLKTNADTGEVDLEFDADGKVIRIERKLKRTTKGVSNEYAAIVIDGERTESSVTEIKSKIVELLGYPPEFVKKNNTLYRFTVYTPQEQMKQIIQEDAESRLTILRHVFGVDKYKKISDNLDVVLLNLKSESKLLQGEVSTLDKDKENLTNYQNRLETVAKKIIEKVKEYEEKEKQRKIQESLLVALEAKKDEKRTFEREVEKTRFMISTKREHLAECELQLKEIDQNITEAGEPAPLSIYEEIQASILSKRLTLDKLNMQHIELNGKMSALMRERTDTLAKNDRLLKLDLCPTCLQNVPEVHKHNVRHATETRMSEIKSTLEISERERSDLIQGIDVVKREIRELEEKKMQYDIKKSRQEYVEKAKKKRDELKRQYEATERDITLLEQHSVNLKEQLFQFTTFETKYRVQQAAVSQATLEERRAEIAIAELKREQELTREEIILLEGTIAIKEERRKKYYELQELIDWLSVQFSALVEYAERNVLLKLRTEFSKVFQKWFLMLVSEQTLEARLDDTFTPLILQGEAEMDYEFLSGGERTAVALAYRLALNQTVNSIHSTIKTRGIIILDEPTDGFSDVQITRIRDILDELNADQLIIVSHEQKIESFVDNVVRVTKSGEGSTVEMASALPLVS